MDGTVILSVAGIIAAVAFIIYFTYKGYSPMILAPIGGAIICITSGINLTQGLITNFATSYGNMNKSMVFVYLMGTMFAAAMVKGQAAYSIAEWLAKLFGKYAAFAVMLMAGIMMIGGMSVGTYMIVFPIGMVLFSKANISKNLMVGCIIGGSWTFGNCFPGSPSNHNNVTMSILGTDAMAGLVPGLVAGLYLIIANGLYLEWQGRHWAKQGHGFESWDELPEDSAEVKAGYPPVWRAWLPIIVVLLLFNVVKLHIAFCMVIGTVLEIVLEFKKASAPSEWFKVCQKGLLDGIMPVCIIAIMSGIGGVVAQTPAYFAMMDWLSTTTVHPYIVAAAGAAIAAFCLGSATSALGIMLPAVLPYFQSAVAAGFDMGVLHRLCVVSSLSLDSLPHNGSIIAISDQFNLSMKDTYFPVFIVSVVNVLIATVLATLVAIVMY